jgi:tetratricopeptide (TPR) repeat protein
MNRQVIALSLILLLLSACSEKMTVTERLRASLDPQVGAFIVEAERSYQRGAYQLALAFADSAEFYEPNLADIYYLRGRIYAALNQRDIADAAFTIVTELDPEYKGARFNLAVNAFHRGDLRQAVNLQLEEMELAETSAGWQELGRAYAKLNVADSAEAAYLKAVELDSTNTAAMMWLGQTYEELGEYEKALEWSKKGLEVQPENTDYQYLVGMLIHRMGNSEEALPILEPMAKAKPWHHGAQINLGQVYMALGREEEANAIFAQADSAQQLTQKINEAYDALDTMPDSLELWTELAHLLRRADRLDEAIDAYKVATSMQPRNLYLQSNLALLYSEIGDLDTAIRRYRAILSFDSTLADIWVNLGVSYAHGGRNDLAKRAWEFALRQDPNQAAARAYLRQLE